jgi:hypothetical protein
MMHWPQYLVLASMALSFAISRKCSGQPRKPYNPVVDLIGIFISLSLLTAGGFFAPIGWSF